jgi:hypothetical protein
MVASHHRFNREATISLLAHTCTYMERNWAWPS